LSLSDILYRTKLQPDSMKSTKRSS